VTIAKSAIFDLLNADNEDTSANKIDAADMKKLNVRIGYMRFRQTKSWDGSGGNDTGYDYTKGNIQLITELGASSSLTGTSYSKTYCGNTTPCTSDVVSCGSGECVAVAGTTDAPARGGTPLVFALKEAKKYLDYHKSKDTSANTCRQKFVVLISDGADTFSCEGDGTVEQANMDHRRRESVAAVKALADKGYRVFVIGLGDNMPQVEKNTLNWIAYYGGTNNAKEIDVGDTSAYNIPNQCNATPAVTADCCTFPLNATGVSTTPSACYPDGSSCSSGTDPGALTLSGYAFLAADKSKLKEALMNAFYSIGDMSYSFTQASIQAVRTADENYIYEAAFEPINNEAFWMGHLKRFSICTAADVEADPPIAGCDRVGSIKTAYDWDAGNVLKNTTASSRNIFTLIGSGVELFTDGNTDITAAHLGVTASADRTAIINLIRGGKEVATSVYWKMGDSFHSSPVSVATPNPLFFDNNDTGSKAYDTFRVDNQRTSANGERIILLGANDGQLHAIKTGDNETETSGGGGSEVWSFVPPSHLPRLKLLTENLHHYFVDGSTTAADIWVASGAETAIGTVDKIASEWKTLMLTSMGRGAVGTLWSSSSGCDTGFSADYDSTTYKYYCGYYAFDVTDTVNTPTYLWRIGGKTGALGTSDGPYWGQPWSKMFIGRVRINNIEKWVGFIGGGFSDEDCQQSGCTGPNDVKAGKGFFVVDLNDGTILWRYTSATDGTMKYDLAARPVAVDTDNDGFVDRAYIGDTFGNVWRFNFCKRDETTCSPTSTCVSGKNCWSGGKLYAAPSSYPIYTGCSVTVDTNYNLWVYWGTGDKTDPTSPVQHGAFYAVKDRGATYLKANLENLTAEGSTYTDSTSGNGWYINLTGQDKILSEPVVFEGRVYFTTYTPTQSTADLCDSAGNSSLFILDYVTASPKLQTPVLDAEGNVTGYEPVRSVDVGSGIATSPIISRNPEGGTSVYISKSVTEIDTETGKEEPHGFLFDDPNMFDNPNNSVIYWQDRRIR
jgi:Tfp pilus tip-associated adhesin PilY1